jgi:hypothetical protein
MVEGPMNIRPNTVEVEVETTQDAAENVAKQQTGLTDVPADAEQAGVSNQSHFPTQQPRLTATAQKTLRALQGR